MNFKKLKKAFASVVVNKSTTATTLMNFLELPADVKSWLLSKFTDDNGNLQAYELSSYIKEMRLKPADWNIKLLEARHTAKGQIKLLTKVNISFDYANDLICFSLPEYSFPKKAKEAQTDWSLVSKHKEQLLNSEGAWGEVTIVNDCGILQLVAFEPLCPYTYDLKTYAAARDFFTTEEWIDVLLGGLNFNPEGFDEVGKLTLLQRFLPFVEKRLNMIELAIKGSAKSYCYSQLSPYNFLTGGTVTRATAFYNLTGKKVGYFSNNDNVIWDEIQTLKSNKPEELNASLKCYLENGEIRVGDYCGTADAGLTLLGNIDIASMDCEEHNMFKKLPKMFRESALIDRFAGIIEGWNIGRFDDGKKFEGWGLSTNYLVEMFHQLRDEFFYRCIVDELLIVDGKCDTRNFEAVKKNCTAYLKLLFPNVKSAADVNVDEFRKYCLEPSIKLRQNVLSQLRFLDEEYNTIEMPVIKIKGE